MTLLAISYRINTRRTHVSNVTVAAGCGNGYGISVTDSASIDHIIAKLAVICDDVVEEVDAAEAGSRKAKVDLAGIANRIIRITISAIAHAL